MAGYKGMRFPSRKASDPTTRFWALVDRQKLCWVWLGGTDQHGYGRFGIKVEGQRKNGRTAWKTVIAPRFSWELRFGPIPDGRFILHRCDNPLCVRPEHLFLGTQDDNMKDMAAKGRSCKGDLHWTRKYPELLLVRSLRAKQKNA